MLRKSLVILISFVVITISGNFALADCPLADLIYSTLTKAASLHR